MSFHPTPPHVQAELARERTPEDPNLLLPVNGYVNSIVPDLLESWLLIPEIQQATEKGPMAQRVLIQTALSHLLCVIDQDYMRNTMAERAALNDSNLTHEIFLHAVVPACLRTIAKATAEAPAETTDTPEQSTQEGA